ncbi:MAG TPA: bifunctional diaminohydroxyphosphoribosylaminopyrimidine deaminase/5-amino-6-(5-phosphoribosylamino)uracil reductase RibD [Thermoanaerobaculia bacterium]|nr:bifunctional diaminohydroxyphosphoribosylaminopyrimidine deaminase/5-amino-6-(5-phosphoribosylamino)uracil reductase RibD [Thermoanaerobaculia bacterium]
MPSSADFLRKALLLAARGRYRTSPNPMVGALVVQGEEIVGRGWHRQVGGPHAEVEALRAAGSRSRGATLYVTLEPCNHHGRTPPCVDAVLAAGISRVVACHRDPHRVAAGGFERLQASAVEVEHGILADEAVRLNLRFLIPAVLDRPAVTLKWAMSLDGRIATAAGESQWISSPSGRRWGLALREEHDAILVGSGTVLADNPRLDRRLGLAGQPNVRVVLDRRLRTPPEARLFQVDGTVLIYTESTDRERCQALEERGAQVIGLPIVEPGAVVADLHKQGIRSILVEGGAEVHAIFVRAGLYDRIGIDCAPLLIGGRSAPGPLGGEGFPSLAGAARLERIETRQRGGDVILMGYRKGCLQELLSSVGA